MRWALELAERRVLPDAVVRIGIRRLLEQRRREQHAGDDERRRAEKRAFVEQMTSSPIAVATGSANEQHYELPARFFETVLGPELKYSSCLWREGVDDLAAAESLMLDVTCERAGIEDGMDVLDLGCGWGSLSLWIARRYPGCSVLAVSNSHSQAEFIRSRCEADGLSNVEVVTRDMNDFVTDRRFDRIVSVEMFEHMRNWQWLFERVASWLRPDGAFLLHVFCHRDAAYPYEDRSTGDWMARFFFTGGIMPSEDLPLRFPEHLEVDRQWRVNGLHYSRTLEAWLDRMDAHRSRLMPMFQTVYGDDARRWFARWRMFFMACSELFRYRGGEEWFVSHSLLRRRPPAKAMQIDQERGVEGHHG
jgi:cyclopropane-fatty-acyl-phospholipid synthase